MSLMAAKIKGACSDCNQKKGDRDGQKKRHASATKDHATKLIAEALGFC
jgi:hypothetical protein